VEVAASRELGEGSVDTLAVREAFSVIDEADGVLVFGTLAYSDGWLMKLSQASKSRKVPITYWSTDDPYEFDLNYRNQSLFDWIWTTDQASVDFYDSPRVEHLPLAADPETHLRSFPSEADYLYDVSFIGVEFPVRREIIMNLAPTLRTLKTAIIGPDWSITAGFIQRRRVTNLEAAVISNLSRVVLSLGRGEYNFFNSSGMISSTPGPRLFEVGAAGTVQIATWYQPEAEEYYAVGEEIVFAEDMADMRSKLLTCVADQGLRRKTAELASRRTRRDHLYSSRLTRVLQRLELLHKR